MVALPCLRPSDRIYFLGVWDSLPRGGLTTLLAATLILTLSACAGSMAMPGGSESLNENCFKSASDMEQRLAGFLPGTSEDVVLEALCVKKEDLQKLDRRDIRIALLGGDNIPFSGEQAVDEQGLMQSLYGYRLNFRNIRRKHGFTSPIRIRTDESGFSYAITLIFQGGALFEKPLLSGGLVSGSSTGTLFEYITPGSIMNHAVP